MAAVLAAGEGAVLSHRAAAALWGLYGAAASPVDVIVTGRARSRPGVRVHRHALREDEVTERDGIPVTTVARTLLDLAGVVTPRGVERAIDQADVLRLLDAVSLQTVIARHQSLRGAGTVRRVLAGHAAGATLTRSELEERFLALCRRARLPRPECNVAITLPDGGMATADFLWRHERLVVETDGAATHHTHGAFEWDRHRDVQLTLAGYEVVRFTWRQITESPQRTADAVAELLRRRRAGDPGRP